MAHRETVKRLLSKVGLEVRRASPQQDLSRLSKSSTSGKVCEFIGISGVGKTTLFNMTFASQRKSWFFEQHVRRILPTSVEDSTYGKVVKSILTEKTAAWSRSNISVAKCSEVLARISDVILVDSNIANGTFARGFALDEGLSHFFAEEIQLLDFDSIQLLYQNRSFVYLRSESPQRILRQTYSRQNRDWPEDSIDPDQEMKSILDQIEIYDRLWETICRISNKTISLNVEDKFRDNIIKCQNFEKQLHSP